MKKDLISIDDLGLEQILDYLDLAARVEALPNAEKAGLLPGKILATLFFVWRFLHSLEARGHARLSPLAAVPAPAGTA